MTATNEDSGTTYGIVKLKNTSIIGTLLPAPAKPPAFDNKNIKNIIKHPGISIYLFKNKESSQEV